MKQIGTGWTMYATDFGEMLPCHWPGYSSSGSTSNPWRTYEAGRTAPGPPGGWSATDGSMGPWNLGMLNDTKIVANPKLFYCPSAESQDNTKSTYEYYSAAGVWPSTTLVSSDVEIRTGYNYFPQGKKLVDNGTGVLVPRAANGTCPGNLCAPLKQNDIDPNRSIFTDLVQNLQDTPHKGGGLTSVAGLNAMFGDTHVNFQSSSGNPQAFQSTIWDPSGANNPAETDYIGNNAANFRYVMSLWQP